MELIARIGCDLINDASQPAINISRLEPPGPKHFRANKRGVPMTMISVVSMHSVPALRADERSPKTVALFCCVGLAASFCLMAFGMDLSAGWV